MRRAYPLMSFFAGMCCAYLSLFAACGGGGGDQPEPTPEQPAEVWLPLPDYVEPVPPVWAEITEQTFVVRVQGNVAEAS